MKHFEWCYFYKTASLWLYTESVHPRICISYMIKTVFISFNILLPILMYRRKFFFPTLHNPKKQLSISLSFCPGAHRAVPCPYITCDRQDAHQFVLIAFWFKVEHFLCSHCLQFFSLKGLSTYCSKVCFFSLIPSFKHFFFFCSLKSVCIWSLKKRKAGLKKKSKN